MKCKTYNKQKGFSIIEILVAFAILSVLTIVLATVLNSASKAYSIADKRTELYQNARIILDQISREIRMAMVYNTGGRYGFHIRAGNTFIADGIDTTDSLYFLGSWDNINADQVSRTVEFGYYVANGPSNVIDRDNILRRCAEPDRLAGGGANPRYNYSTSANWMTGNQYEPLAYGVSDFQIEWFGSFPAGNPDAWQNGEYNPTPPPRAYLRSTIPRAIRMTVELLHPDDEIRYAGDAARIDSLKISFNTVVFLNNSPGF